jgi:hypothetical protein
MKIDKNKILQSCKRDLKAADTLRLQNMEKISQWKSESEGLPYGNEVKGKSRIVSKDIMRQREWLVPKLADPFLGTSDIIKCNPVTYEDSLAAKQNELVLNTQFCRKFNRYNFIMKSLNVLITEGTLVVQTGWDYEDKTIEEQVEVVCVDEFGNEFITTQTQEVVKVLKNQPTAVVCRNEDIYIDPTCMDDMDKCQFIIHRYETDLSTLRSDGRYKNLDKVAKAESNEDNDFVSEDTTDFKFEDSARKKMVVYEYWGNYDINGDGIAEPIVCSWIGDIIIRLQDNPYPDKKPPFLVVPFNAVPFQMYGEGLASSIGDKQKIKTAILRGIIDNMAQSNNAQIGIRKNALDMANRKKFLAGKNFEYNGLKEDFWQGSYNQIPGSVFDMLSIMNNEIESQTGIKSFSGGINSNSLGSTATGARGAMDATATRQLSLVRNIAENLIKPLMRKWMSYNSEFLEEEEIVRITNSKFIPIKRDDLEGNIDIDISISTSEDNAAKAQELAFMMQTGQQTMDPEETRMIRAEIARLQRMPELEQKILSFEPNPDPLAQKMKEVELEKAMLELEKIKADIADKYARAGENEVDRELKLKKAKVEEAKARKLNSDADIADMNFLRTDEGVDHKEKMELENFKRLSNLDSMALQIANKDTNIGVTN